MAELSVDPIIHTRNLTESFSGATAVDRLSLDIPRGANFDFIGPRGCGKTISVRLLLGLMSNQELLPSLNKAGDLIQVLGISGKNSISSSIPLPYIDVYSG